MKSKKFSNEMIADDDDPEAVEIKDNNKFDTIDTEPGKIDPDILRFPYCIVWRPLPFISWFLPIIGHTGICTYLQYTAFFYLIPQRTEGLMVLYTILQAHIMSV